MRGTLGGILGEWGPLLLDLGDGTPDGTFAGFPLPPALINTGTDVNQGSPVPSDLHQTFAEYDPTYQADETIATLEFSYDFGPMTLTTVAGYQETSFLSQTDYNWTIAGLAYDGPAVAAFGGAIPISEIDGAAAAARSTATSATPACSRATTTSRTRKPTSGRPRCACPRSSKDRGTSSSACSTWIPTTTRTTTSSPASSTTGRR